MGTGSGSYKVPECYSDSAAEYEFESEIDLSTQSLKWSLINKLHNLKDLARPGVAGIKGNHASRNEVV